MVQQSDISEVQRIAGELFQGRNQVSKGEIEQRVNQSSLSEDAKQQVHNLPDGQYTKEDLMQRIESMVPAEWKDKVGGLFGG